MNDKRHPEIKKKKKKIILTNMDNTLEVSGSSEEGDNRNMRVNYLLQIKTAFLT